MSRKGYKDKGSERDRERPRDFIPTWGSPPGGPQLPGGLQPPGDLPAQPPLPPWASPPLPPRPPQPMRPPEPPPGMELPKKPVWHAPPAPPPSAEVASEDAVTLKPRIGAPPPIKRLRPRRHQEGGGSRGSADKPAARSRFTITVVGMVAALVIFAVVVLMGWISVKGQVTHTDRPSTRTTTATTQGTGELLVTVDSPADGVVLAADTVDVTGKVTTEDGHPLAGAEVGVRVGSRSELKGQTDEGGRFSIQAALFPGTNNVTVTASALSTWGRTAVSCRCDAGAAPGPAGQ